MTSSRGFCFSLLLIALCATFNAVDAQQVYTSDKVDYAFDVPTASWRVIAEPDVAHEHAEFVNGDRLEGYLQIRKEVVDAGVTAEELARRDLDTKLRFLPGFIEGKQEKFAGKLSGVMATYEFVRTGKAMLGRIYYLQADSRTIYALRFSGLRDTLTRIRNQTDVMARSFHLK